MTGIPSPAAESQVFDDDQLAGLVARIATGDRAAFAEFYDCTIHRAYALVHYIVHADALVEDALNEAYLQVWQQAARYDPQRSKAMGWLSVICRSRALDLRRRRKSTQSHETAELPADIETADDAPDNPEVDLLQAVEARSALHTALLALSDQERQLLALAYFRGYSHAQLSTASGLPLGTVKSLIRRALIKLRRPLAEHQP